MVQYVKNKLCGFIHKKYISNNTEKNKQEKIQRNVNYILHIFGGIKFKGYIRTSSI